MTGEPLIQITFSCPDNEKLCVYVLRRFVFVYFFVLQKKKDDSYTFYEKKSNIKLVSSAKFKHYVLRTDIINGWSQAQGRIGVPKLFLINPKNK